MNKIKGYLLIATPVILLCLGLGIDGMIQLLTMLAVVILGLAITASCVFFTMFCFSKGMELIEK